MQTQLESRAIAPSATASPKAFGTAATGVGANELLNLERARQFLSAIEEDCKRAADDLTSSATDFYAADVVQEEFPNRFLPNGASRSLQELREAAARGRKVMRAQRFEPRTVHAIGETVILEVLWVGTVSIQLGALAPGDEMRAHFAVFLEFRDGLIVHHRTYDCFEPF